MAPEVVSDTTYRTLPNTDTDRHSLAVLLFYSLFLGHPLEGDRTDAGLRDAQWLLSHFGTEPLFCMHPTTRPTGPAEIVQQYWKIYPQFLRDLFVQAFVDGIDNPGARVTEGQWIKAMDRLRDGMLACPTCGTTNFWSSGEPDPVCRQGGTPLSAAVPAQDRSPHRRGRPAGGDPVRPPRLRCRPPGRARRPRQHPQDPAPVGPPQRLRLPVARRLSRRPELRARPRPHHRAASPARGSRSATTVVVRRPERRKTACWRDSRW